MQVSLITCTNNSEKTIKDCCKSILSQTYENIEHIVLDKQSSDTTLNIAKNFKVQNQKQIQQKSVGIYSAINEGLKIAKGDIVGLLHSDDEFVDNEVLNKVVKIFDDHKVDVIFSNLFYTAKNDKNKIIRKWTTKLKSGIQSNDFIRKKIHNGWMPPHTTLFLKKKLIGEVGYYNENFKISSDYDFIIRLFSNKNLKIFFLNEFTVKMKIGGISNKNLQSILIKMKEDYDIMKKNNLPPVKTIFLKNISKIMQFL